MSIPLSEDDVVVRPPVGVVELRVPRGAFPRPHGWRPRLLGDGALEGAISHPSRRGGNITMVRFRLKTLRAGWGPIGGDVEVRPGDREILNPLFEVLRDRRALLHSGHGRGGQAPYVTESIKAIREQLTRTLQQLPPDSEARSWVEKLRAACREYLTAVESENADATEFEPAIAQLRAAFFEVANHAAAYYRLPAARELATEMASNRDVPVSDAGDSMAVDDEGPTGYLGSSAAISKAVPTLDPLLLRGRVYPYHYLPAMDSTEKALCLRSVAAVGVRAQPEPTVTTESEEIFEQLLGDSQLEQWIVDGTSRSRPLPANSFWRSVYPTRSTIVTLQRPATTMFPVGWTIEGKAGLNLRPHLSVQPVETAWVNVDAVIRPDTDQAPRSLALSLEDLFSLFHAELGTLLEDLVPEMVPRLTGRATYELRAVTSILSATGASLGDFVPLVRSDWRRAEGAFDPQGGEWSLEDFSEVEDTEQRTNTVRRWFKTLLRDAGIRGHERFIDALPASA